MTNDALMARFPSFATVHGLAVPHIEQYFGVWGILENPFREAVAHANAIDVRAHVVDADPKANAQGAAITQGVELRVNADGVAVIDISGHMMKFESSFGGTGTVQVRRELRAAAGDDRVRSIALRIDSPGGTVAGTDDLALEVAAAAKQKPVHAFVEDMCASCAFWVASQATQVFATRTSLIGAIGTFMVIHDLSGQAEQAGVKVHVVRAGALKGAGTPGTEITDEQLVEFQRVVDGLNEHFVKAIAAGRSMSLKAAQKIADGRVHIGEAAIALRLIDGIKTFEETLAGLAGGNRKQTSRAQGAATKEIAMEKEKEAATAVGSPELLELKVAGPTAAGPRAATLAELKATLPDSDAVFREGCQEAGATLEVAKDRWIAAMHKKHAAQAEEIEALKAKAAKPGAPPVGVKGGEKTANGAEFENATAQWNDLVQKQRDRGKSKQAASLAVNRLNPGLREAMVAEANEGLRVAG